MIAIIAIYGPLCLMAAILGLLRGFFYRNMPDGYDEEDLKWEE